ncbi:MAG: alpha/beta hydrolase fold domain-containing protein [Tepidisphaerales bacterium]
MRFLIGLFAILCSTACITAMGQAQPGQPAAPSPGVRVERNLRYVPDGDAAHVLDLYLPQQASEKPLPLVVWVHGGAWRVGSKAACPPTFLLPNGYAAASIEYRFSDKAHFPAQIQDCQAAVRFLRANAGKYNLDAKHIGVWGESAGGHLAALLGTAGGTKAFSPVGGNEDQSDRVQAVCDLFGPTDFNTVMAQAAADTVKNIIKFNTPGDPYSELIGVKLGADKRKDDAVSPVHYVSKDDPPFLIMHGTADTYVPFAQSVELARALRQAGVTVVLQRFPGAGHGAPVFQQPAVRDLIKRFFDKHLKGMNVTVGPLPAADVTVPPPAGKP